MKLLLLVLLTAILVVVGHLMYLRNWTAGENYPSDSCFARETNKTALIIVAHDDDMVGSSGTIGMLCKNGWKVMELCFYQQGGLYAQKDSLKNPIRKNDLRRVAGILGLSAVYPVDLNFRKDMYSEAAYMPMPYSSFDKNYQLDSLQAYIRRFIGEYKPSVIFTLDDIIGGYGNPDHVAVSRVVMDHCRRHGSDPGFSVRKIYQPVFPPGLASHALDPLPVYQRAKEVYQVPGMPIPDVQVDISDYGAGKKAAMTAYTTEQHSIRAIYPYYHWYPHWVYFRVFDREFFRVVDVGGRSFVK